MAGPLIRLGSRRSYTTVLWDVTEAGLLRSFVSLLNDTFDPDEEGEVGTVSGSMQWTE